MELPDIIKHIQSANYKERFRGEYHYIKRNYDHLNAILEKWDAGTLDFTPDCPRGIYDLQIRAMSDYIAVLEARAKIEGVNLQDFIKLSEYSENATEGLKNAVMERMGYSKPFPEKLSGEEKKRFERQLDYFKTVMKTVAFDFDGVIHSYQRGWEGDESIPDPPVPGIGKALKEIHDTGYDIVIYSTRAATLRGYNAMEAWLEKYDLLKYIDMVFSEKPPAIVYIDDRAIRFDGNPDNLLEQIRKFKPWWEREQS